jgi:cobalt-zinc-cadmium efflux system outer membrane protein
MVANPMRNKIISAFCDAAAGLACGLSLAWPAAGLAQEQPLSLREAEARLETGNRELIAARHALEIASSGVLIAGAVPNPVLSASATSINPWRPSIGGPLAQRLQVDSVLHVDQVIERGNKRELRVSAANSQVDAAQRDLDEVRRQQRLALDLAYYDLKLALDRARIQTETSTLHEQSVRAAEQRLKAGDAAESEVVRLRVEALRAANDARTAQADVTRARQALGLLIGEVNPLALMPVDDWPGDAAIPADEIGPESVQSRPDVRAAQARVSAAERSRELARALRTRDVTVGGQVERFPPDPKVSFGVNMAVPLFTNYYFEGEIAQAEAELTAAMAARERQVLLALNEVRRARTDMQSAAERRQRLVNDLLPNARRSLESAEFAYQRGASGLLDLLDARRTLRALELEAATAAADFAKARAALVASQYTDPS